MDAIRKLFEEQAAKNRENMARSYGIPASRFCGCCTECGAEPLLSPFYERRLRLDSERTAWRQWQRELVRKQSEGQDGVRSTRLDSETSQTLPKERAPGTHGSHSSLETHARRTAADQSPACAGDDCRCLESALESKLEPQVGSSEQCGSQGTCAPANAVLATPARSPEVTTSDEDASRESAERETFESFASRAGSLSASWNSAEASRSVASPTLSEYASMTSPRYEHETSGDDDFLDEHALHGDAPEHVVGDGGTSTSHEEEHAFTGTGMLAHMSDTEPVKQCMDASELKKRSKTAEHRVCEYEHASNVAGSLAMLHADEDVVPSAAQADTDFSANATTISVPETLRTPALATETQSYGNADPMRPSPASLVGSRQNSSAALHENAAAERRIATSQGEVAKRPTVSMSEPLGHALANEEAVRMALETTGIADAEPVSGPLLESAGSGLDENTNGQRSMNEHVALNATTSPQTLATLFIATDSAEKRNRHQQRPSVESDTLSANQDRVLDESTSNTAHHGEARASALTASTALAVSESRHVRASTVCTAATRWERAIAALEQLEQHGRQELEHLQTQIRLWRMRIRAHVSDRRFRLWNELDWLRSSCVYLGWQQSFCDAVDKNAGTTEALDVPSCTANADAMCTTCNVYETRFRQLQRDLALLRVHLHIHEATLQRLRTGTYLSSPYVAMLEERNALRLTQRHLQSSLPASHASSRAGDS
ncbi:hypothetical protein CYME_CMK110C [Cyanidioschyzon merolae strain 10D]|uniref:Uncharacterized protein n=1 Tax=Cyanidioschyzon merolae (strain NIES-3377 / 10D) TaxID=280699 RepID=M1VHR9_CYAM1|nr:hypothetical protein CYME_CMK110C [Cyanidioschyzon merolae strain 10D]BAM80493.1 hypothetical protein CYME_CMK110C [Cyanidioschyzon merolae strain 10D]|eukprot:XP_005536529.1 hypothetical protein CYME_CMK110C [Cyanidioschyzon merolae strain 10D]